MRFSILTLGLLASASLAAPVPFPSSSANRPLFEAKNADHAKTAVGRFTSDVFHDRVLLVLTRHHPDFLRGQEKEEQRQWLKGRLRAERQGDARVRVVISGTDDRETRGVRDAVTAVLTTSPTPQERAMLEASRLQLELGGRRVNIIRGGGRIVNIRGGVVRDQDFAVSRMQLEQFHAEMNAEPLKKVN